MVRNFILLLLAAVAVRAFGQHSTLDPAFEKIPFDRWLSERDQARFHWTASVSRAELTFHQRLMAQVEVRLDGRDLETRRGDGELVFFVQIADGDGTRHQVHTNFELSKVDENIKAINLEYSQPAFFLPGDFRLAVAILDTATGEHSTRRSQFRIATPPHDFLKDAWSDLPAVELIRQKESPDSWFLPDMRGRLQWAASVRSPARINVVLSVAPSIPALGSRRTTSSALAALLPTVKAISETGSSSVSERIELLDLARRRAMFHQDEVHDIDWPHLKTSLAEANTVSIDVHSLSERHHDAQFFVSQVRGILRAAEGPCVLVVLTTPVAFESGEDLEPVSLEGLPACPVFYIRFHQPVQSIRPFDQQIGGRGRGSRTGGGSIIPNLPPQDVVDQLAATLKPLAPKVFDVQTAEQMTRVLAEIEKALRTSDGPPSR
jgi:hypothetical protein